MKRRHGLAALIAVVTISASMSACGASGKAETPSGGGAVPAANAVVTHSLDIKPAEVRSIFRAGAAGSGAIPAGTVVNGKTTAQPFDGIPRVGAIFFGVGNVPTVHYCTASVVHSSSGDLIATAAHCVHNTLFGGWQNKILFVPGYHDEVAPLGVWVATTAYLDQHWIDNEDPDSDIAFLKVVKAGGGSAKIEDQTGASTFTAAPGYTNTVSVASYPLTAAKPVGCSATTARFTDTQLQLPCSGLPDGASGSPFIATGDRLVGILGGYQQGGNSPDTSYSVYFTDRIAAVFKAASGS